MTPLPQACAAALALLVLLAPSPAGGQDAPPCSTPEFRQFDFWVGDWDVFGPDGARAGRNRITREMGGCVLHERYDGAGGYHGESFNVHDATRRVWHQTWVDNRGTLLRLEGGFREGRMRLEGETVGADGKPLSHRIVWSLVENDPDRVRQLWETSSDGGRTWSVTFDGEYRRRASSGS